MENDFLIASCRGGELPGTGHRLRYTWLRCPRLARTMWAQLLWVCGQRDGTGHTLGSAPSPLGDVPDLRAALGSMDPRPFLRG